MTEENEVQLRTIAKQIVSLLFSTQNAIADAGDLIYDALELVYRERTIQIDSLQAELQALQESVKPDEVVERLTVASRGKNDYCVAYGVVCFDAELSTPVDSLTLEKAGVRCRVIYEALPKTPESQEGEK